MAAHYVDQLNQVFDKRVERNPRYSLRAFARDVGLSVSRLSEVMNGGEGLSATKAREICKRLKLPEVERQVFLTSVDASHSRSPIKRKTAEIILRNLLQARNRFTALELDSFKLISEWYHFAVLEMTRLDDYKGNFDWIAKELGITQTQVKNAAERLVRLGLAEIKDGVFACRTNHTMTPFDIPSQAIRQMHSSMLSLAEEKLTSVPVQHREYNSMVLSVHSSNMELMKSKIREFHRNFSQEFDTEDAKDSVYALTVQFFPLKKLSLEDKST